MDYEAGADIFKGWTVTGKGKEGAAGSFYEIRKKHCGRTIKKGLKVLQVPGYIAADVVKQTFLLIQMKDLPGIAKYEAYQVFDRGSSCLEIAIRTQLYTPLPEYQKTHVLHREDIWQMARELCAALDAGWQRGLFHGHITPENVLVDQKGHFFLSDFGMAELTHRNMWSSQPFAESERDVCELGILLQSAGNLSVDNVEDPFANVLKRACSTDPEEHFCSAGEMLRELNAIPKKIYQKAYRITIPGKRQFQHKCLAASALGISAFLTVAVLSFQGLIPQKLQQENMLELSDEIENLPSYSEEDFRPVAELLGEEELKLLQIIRDGLTCFNQAELRETRVEELVRKSSGEEQYSINTIITVDESVQKVRKEEQYSSSTTPDIHFYTVEDGKDYMYDTYFGYDEERKDYRDQDERVYLDETAPAGMRYGFFAADQELCGGELENEEKYGYISCEVREKSNKNGVLHIEVEYLRMWKTPYTRENVMESNEISEEDLSIYNQGEQVVSDYARLMEQNRKRGSRVTWNYWIDVENHIVVQSRKVSREQETLEEYDAFLELYKMRTYLNAYKELIMQGNSEWEARRRAEESVKRVDETQPAYDERSYSDRLTTSYLTGENCTEMTGFPSSYRDISYAEVQDRLNQTLYGD